jgi:hypothetical protein
MSRADTVPGEIAEVAMVQPPDGVEVASHARPINSLEDLQSYAVELFDSDEEVEEFLAFVREIRNADIV